MVQPFVHTWSTCVFDYAFILRQIISCMARQSIDSIYGQSDLASPVTKLMHVYDSLQAPLHGIIPRSRGYIITLCLLRSSHAMQARWGGNRCKRQRTQLIGRYMLGGGTPIVRRSRPHARSWSCRNSVITCKIRPFRQCYTSDKGPTHGRCMHDAI